MQGFLRSLIEAADHFGGHTSRESRKQNLTFAIVWDVNLGIPWVFEKFLYFLERNEDGRIRVAVVPRVNWRVVEFIEIYRVTVTSRRRVDRMGNIFR